MTRVPTGYHAITPYLMVADIAPVIDFVERVFGAEVTEKFAAPDGTIVHAEVRIDDSKVILRIG